ncbi:MAG: protoporphyrinogen oxidase [Opitutaceae bacterium]|nr:protoporphyrinogen oxidase [Opitutaceae bacterium]
MFRPDPSPALTAAALRLGVAVVGGGITGLTAAYRLHRAGVRVRVFEAAGRVGGAIGTFCESGWMHECGPNTIQLNSRPVAELIKELGLSGQMLEANPLAKNRFLLRNGRICAVPRSPFGLVSTRLFSPAGKVRIFKDLFIEPHLRKQDVALSEFVAEHFGQEAVDRAFSAFVSGVYAGDAGQLSTKLSFPTLWRIERQYGSLIRGMVKLATERKRKGEPKTKLVSFAQGLQALPEALAKALPNGSVELGAEVSHLNPPRLGGPWTVRWQRDGVSQNEQFAAVLLALPAHQLVPLTIGLDPQESFAALSQVSSPPVTSLFLGFKRQDVPHPLNGFGMLVPPVENRKLLGVLFSSSLFPGRAPEGHVALTAMVGGSRLPEVALLDDAALLDLVRSELASIMGIKATPVYTRRVTWRHAIPQYTLGYEQFLDTIEVAEGTFPGLFVGGQVRDGISVPNCIEAGFRLAERCLA